MNTEQQLAKFILQNADKFEWSLQGMGMLRLYLTPLVRLHVWDSRYRNDGVSMIHDHLQWSLHSTIIAGELRNRRYTMANSGEPTHMCGMLKPGYGCYFKDSPVPVRLLKAPVEQYRPGQSYRQTPAEIHETDAADGTVTLMRKVATDDDSARVFWPVGFEWGSAEPRKATPQEVRDITEYALERWFK